MWVPVPGLNGRYAAAEAAKEMPTAGVAAGNMLNAASRNISLRQVASRQLPPLFAVGAPKRAASVFVRQRVCKRNAAASHDNKRRSH